MELTRKPCSHETAVGSVEVPVSLPVNVVSPVLVDNPNKDGASSHMLNGNVLFDYTRIKQEANDDLARNGISLNSCGYNCGTSVPSVQSLVMQASMLDQCHMGCSNTVSQAVVHRAESPGLYINQPDNFSLKSKLSSTIARFHTSATSGPSDGKGHISDLMKHSCANISRNHINFPKSSKISPAYFESYSSVTNLTASTSDFESGFLECFPADKLFDPSIVAPNASLESALPITGNMDEVLTPGFLQMPLVDHDVCQTLMNDVLEMEKHKESLTSMKLRPSSPVLTLSNKNTTFESESLHLSLDNSANSLVPQGLSDSHKNLSVSRIPNGISSQLYSSNFDISQTSICDAKTVNISHDRFSVLDQSSTQNILNNCTDVLVSVNEFVARSSSACDDSTCSTLGSGEKENLQMLDKISKSEDKPLNLTACVKTSVETDGLGAVQLKGILRRTPKAKKSCVSHSKEPAFHDSSSQFPLEVNDSTLESKVTLGTETSVTAQAGRSTLSSMTIKLPELENVLGIGYKSLDKMDAKTLDKIVLAKAQRKFKMEIELEKLNRNAERCENFIYNRSSCEKAVHDCSKLNTSMKFTIASIKRTGSTPIETSGKHLPLNSADECVISSNTKLKNCIDLSESKSSSLTEPEKLICMNNSLKKNENLESTLSLYGKSEENDYGKSESKFVSRNKCLSNSNQLVTNTNLSPIKAVNGTVFKAKKSQSYAFGRGRSCLEILSPHSSKHYSHDLISQSSSADIRHSLPLAQTGRSSVMSDNVSELTLHNKMTNHDSSSDLHVRKGCLVLSETGGAETGADKSKREPHTSLCKNLNHKRKSETVLTLRSSPDGLSTESKRKKLLLPDMESFPVPQSRPVKPLKLESRMNQDHLDQASISSSSSTDNFSVKLLRRKLSNKINYHPVTPPKSPDGCTVQSSDEFSLQSTCQVKPDNQTYFLPQCCCSTPSLMELRNLKSKCQALESIEGKVTGCMNKVTWHHMVRPSSKIPFMMLCDHHLKYLSNHQCCPGCGQFCIQGEFYQCKQHPNEVHTFHRHCQVFHDSKYYCPHCGVEFIQEVTVLQPMEPSTLSPLTVENIPKQISKVSCNARIGASVHNKRQKSEDSLYSTNSISSMTSQNSQTDDSGLLGLDIEDLKASLAVLGRERPKKIRPCTKSLYGACKNGELERVLYMIDEGIDPNIVPEDYDETSLHVAAKYGHINIVKLLLQAGAMANSVDHDLHTPLMEAAAGGHCSLMRVLIKAGAVLNAKDNYGMTVLHTAAKSGQLDVIHYLLESHELDVNVKDDGGWTPVIWATEHKHVATVKFLLKMGANPKLQDNEMNNGLHWAAFAGSADIAELFLNGGCDLECENANGDRPLHIAVRQNHYECVSLFLLRGANVEAVNKGNDTPIECCTNGDNQTRLSLLVNRHLRKATANRPNRPERLIHKDISLGREPNPVTVVNGFDEEVVPRDFVYVCDYVETIPVNINRVFTNLRMCLCEDECSTINCNCIRSNIKCCYDKDGHLVEEFRYQDPPLIFECNRACRCFANCQNRVVQLGITCRLQVFRTDGRGWGCRTLLNISKGSFVCEYFGELISDAEADRRQDDSYLFDLDNQETDTFCVDAAKYGNVSRFINHLCEPNLTPVKVFIDHQDLRFPRMCFFANRDINSYEELGFDYGDKFWVIKYKHFTCTCGSPKCRYSEDTIGKTLEDFKRRQDEDLGSTARK